jgi:hypothetical protein
MRAAADWLQQSLDQARELHSQTASRTAERISRIVLPAQEEGGETLCSATAPCKIGRQHVHSPLRPEQA